MEPRISITTLGVADLERLTRFYRDGLGLPHDSETQGISFFPLQGAWLALYPRHVLAADANQDSAGSGFSGVTFAHNVRSKGEVDRLLALAEAAGADIIKPAQDAEWGGYSGYFADPDGHLSFLPAGLSSAHRGSSEAH
jgi:catechol 2,3-dioxygenase-like lactoylglutathione lyase family enzyme